MNNIVPITALTPFNAGGRQTIKARVADKGDIKTWNKATGSGKLFSCTLHDETSSIRATFFNDGVDQYHGMLQNGSVYLFSNFQIKPANKQFSGNINNDYELNFDGKAEVQQSNDQAAAIPMHRFNFIPISVIASKKKWDRVDILAAVCNVGDVVTVNSRAENASSHQRRSITLGDSSATINLELWNNDVDRIHVDVGTIIGLRNATVGEFKEAKTLGIDSKNNTTGITISPSTNDANSVIRWYQETGGKGVQDLSKRAEFEPNSAYAGNYQGRRYLNEIDTMNLGKGEKPDIIDCIVHVTRVAEIKKKDERANSDGPGAVYYYEACSNMVDRQGQGKLRECNKRLNANVDGSWTCPTCNLTTNDPACRWMFTVEICDGVHSRWVAMWDDTGFSFMGMTAKSFKTKINMAGNPGVTDMSRWVQNRLHKPFLMRAAAKEETWKPDNQQGDPSEQQQDHSRVKLNIKMMTPLLRLEGCLFKDEPNEDDGGVEKKHLNITHDTHKKIVSDEMDHIMKSIRAYPAPGAANNNNAIAAY